MTKEELIEFLTNNLSIQIKKDYGMYEDHDTIEVELKLCGESISSDFL